MCDDQDGEMEDASSSLPEELKSKRDRKIMAYGHFTVGVKAVKSFEVFKKLRIDMNLKTLHRWFHDFKLGKIKFTDVPKSGRKPAKDREENVQKIKELIEADPYISYRLIKEQTNVATGSITRILRTDLKLEKYNNLWIPIGLSKPEKDARVKRFEKMYPPKPKEKKTRRRRTVQPPDDHNPMTADNFVT